MAAYASGPIPFADFAIHSPSLEYGQYPLQTTRRISLEEGTWHAIYSGHDGSAVARYLYKNLHLLFEQAKGVTIKEKFENAFKTADDNCKQTRKKSNGYMPGASVSVVFIKNGTAHLANIGDCRTCIMRNGAMHYSTPQHDVDNGSELNRLAFLIPGNTTANEIIKRFFFKQEEPLFDSLQSHKAQFTFEGTGYKVTRAIGDGDGQRVICTPDYYEHQLAAEDTTIFMGSNVFWEILSRKKINDDAFGQDFIDNNSEKLELFKQKYTHPIRHYAIMLIDFSKKADPLIIKTIPLSWENIKNTMLTGSAITLAYLSMLFYFR